MMAPLQVELLLRALCHPDGAKPDNEVERKFCGEFALQDVMKVDTANWRLTLKGVAWVKLILATPMPRAIFVDREGNEVSPEFP